MSGLLSEDVQLLLARNGRSESKADGASGEFRAPSRRAFLYFFIFSSELTEKGDLTHEKIPWLKSSGAICFPGLGWAFSIRRAPMGSSRPPLLFMADSVTLQFPALEDLGQDGNV